MRHFALDTAAVLLLLWICFLAAAEGFSARGLSRPWEKPKKRVSHYSPKKKNSALVRFYVNEQYDSEDREEEEKDSAKAAAAATPHQEHEANSSGDKSFVLQEPEIVSLSSESQAPVTDCEGSSLGSSVSSVALPEEAFLASTVSASSDQRPTIRSSLSDLIAMTRPSNDPGVVLFHLIGIYLVAPKPEVLAAAGFRGFWGLVFSPSMMVTLLALLLTSSTSMLVNDYYDFKLGNDSSKANQPLSSSDRLSLGVVKRFLSYLYAAALVCVTIVPGVPARMAVVSGLMLTFWYTQHLKPRTWLKNAVCASLIALSPLTSGIAAMSLTSSANSAGLGPLLRLVSILFVGILGREITMDINDVADDSLHGVRTVPVRYGRKFASGIGLSCSLTVAGLALAGPLVQTLQSSAPVGSAILKSGLVRRWVLASAGSAAQVWRSLQVFQSGGENPDINHRAVTEGLLTVVLLLASFV